MDEMNDDDLYQRIAEILNQARGAVARTINTVMVQAYWHIGREIVEIEQGGERRAGYGEAVLDRLSKRLVDAYGAGFSAINLRRMRRFYLGFPKGSAIRPTPSTEFAIGSTASTESEASRSRTH